MLNLPGQSFYKENGNWKDFYYETKNGNFCIGARTVYTGDDVLVMSFSDGATAGTPSYQFSSKKITPGKKAQDQGR